MRIIGDGAIPLTIERQGVLETERPANLKSQLVNFPRVGNADKLNEYLNVVYGVRLHPDVGVTKLLFVEGLYVAANTDGFLCGGTARPKENAGHENGG